MDEARRFLRYILPGLVFSVVLLIALLISDNDAIIDGLVKSRHSCESRNPAIA